MLVDQSPTATWFQTLEAYQFYASQKNEMIPFAIGVSEDDRLVGVVVGYITQEKNTLKQFLTRRAIIVGGPLLAENISDEALTALLLAVTNTSRLSPSGVPGKVRDFVGCSFASRLKRRSTLIPCGINLTDDQLLSRSEARKILGLHEDEIIILFAGAFDNAVKDAPLARQTVELASSLSPLASRLVLQELRGFSRAEVNCWMCAANALLMTSKTEGSPQVIKEAMACGCPIVSVDVGDVAERTSGVEGCYVVPSREPAAIAEALQQAIAFEGRTNGREKIIEMGLSNEQVAKRLIAIYKSLV